MRLSHGIPRQVFIGSVDARSVRGYRLVGRFHPLTADGGASAGTGSFPFTANRLAVCKPVRDGVEDGCLAIRVTTTPVTLDTCADAPGKLFAIEPRPPLPGTTTPRLAILAHEPGA